MKIAVISNIEDAGTRVTQAKQLGYVTFIYRHADPEKMLGLNKFSYIEDDAELQEKLRLIRADSSLLDEMARW